MSTRISNTPALLIPKELFKEEKIREYWNLLHPGYQPENLGKDNLKDLFLLYSKSEEEESTHEITILYEKFIEKFSDHEHAICINVHEIGFNLLVIKNRDIAYTGYFHYSGKEDVLYHLANVSQRFFEDISSVVFIYQQLPTSISHFLDHYYEMKKI